MARPPSFNFDGLVEDNEVEWPIRGRRSKPLPEKLVMALHQSFEHGTTPSMAIPTSRKNTFINLLNRAGKELGYRIEKVIKDDVPKEGYSTFYFRTRHLRKNHDNAN